MGVHQGTGRREQCNIPANKRVPIRLINPRNHRTHKPRPEPPLIQTRTDQIRKRLWTYIPLLPQPVHVDFVAKQLGDGGDVGGEARKAEVDLGAVGEDLGEVV